MGRKPSPQIVAAAEWIASFLEAPRPVTSMASVGASVIGLAVGSNRSKFVHTLSVFMTASADPQTVRSDSVSVLRSLSSIGVTASHACPPFVVTINDTVVANGAPVYPS